MIDSSNEIAQVWDDERGPENDSITRADLIGCQGTSSGITWR